jgi:tetratricopeptide (TPR) repeat protein
MRLLWIVAVIISLAADAVAQTAEDLYTQGQEAYDRKNYAEAIERWQASYRMSNEEALFFNIGQAQRLSGDCHGAVESYRRFTQSDPDPSSEQHKLAEYFVRDLGRVCAPSPKLDIAPVRTVDDGIRSAESRPVDSRPVDSSRGKTLKISGLVIGGTGLATLATGIYLGRHAQSIGDEVTAACRTSCDWSAWKDRDVQGQRYSTIGRGLAVTGGIGIAGGVALYYLGMRQGSVTIEPRAHEGAVVSWAGSW